MAVPGNADRQGMTPTRWRKVGELFHEALEVPTEARVEWVKSACKGDAALVSEVNSLLGCDVEAETGFLAAQIKPAVESYSKATPELGHPDRVGPYRLVRELGRGGMGTVYLAERADDQYQTKVAIKVVRRGMDTDLILHRFRRERQTLARLQHPNIARLLDGSTTEDGLPYIVMEYINGPKITDYCSSHSLGVAERLGLFLEVSAAVEYAHRHFVVHRDLKPGNILVDESGVAKLLDFGICKLLHTDRPEADDTMEGSPPLLTPDYASPEQIRGDVITISSDIYSLGAVLYELLTGTRPHRIEEYSLKGIERGICETEILHPSLAASNKSMARKLQGDIDNILMRALNKDPQRRYPSMEQFSEDVRRHLTHQPVKARPDTLPYRIQKFVRRRSGLVAALAAVIVSLLAGVVFSTRAERTAKENLRLVRQLSNTFVFDVHDAVRDLPGSTRARQLIVQTGLQYLDTLSRNAQGDTDLQRELAAAYHRIGDVQGNVMGANLGNTTEALASYRKALALLEPVLRRDPGNRQLLGERVTILQRIGDVHAYTRDSKQAIASYGDAERLAEDLLARHPDDEGTSKQLANIYIAAADVTRLTGDYTSALTKNSKAKTILLRAAERNPVDQSIQVSLASAYSAVGMCDVRLGRLKEGLEGYRQAAQRMERVVQTDSANVSNQRGLMFAYAHIGDVLGNANLPNLGDSAGATEAYRQMSEVARRLHEADPADQRATSDYAIALARVAVALPEDRPELKLAVIRQSLRLHEEVAKVNPGNLSNRADMVFTHSLLGDTLQLTGDRSGAVAAYRDSLKLAEPLLQGGSGAATVTAIGVYRKLADDSARHGDRTASLGYAEQALQLSEAGGATGKARPADLQRFLTPRGPAVMGLAYARLSEARSQGVVQARDDAAIARQWLGKSLDSWRVLVTHPSFAPAHRREMQVVEATLAGLQ